MRFDNKIAIRALEDHVLQDVPAETWNAVRSQSDRTMLQTSAELSNHMRRQGSYRASFDPLTPDRTSLVYMDILRALRQQRKLYIEKAESG